ncbi:MAG: vWA domain-containing protein, partial [Acidimicrobiia bacterium]
AGVYHVAPAGDPPGGSFRRLGTVTTSLDAAGPYADVVAVDEGTPTTRRFAFRRTNPPFPARCGVRVTLLYDLSGSIDATEAARMKDASLAFVDALAGTPSAIAVASFATDAPAARNANLAPTAVDTTTGVSTVKAAIAALDPPTGDARYTNWDAALRAVVGQSDIVVLFTDGNPTVHGVPAEFPPVQTGLDQIDAGVVSANAVKAAGARMLAVGVGNVDEVAPDNLAAVSGPVEGSDYAITTFADVGTVFRSLADALCPKPETPVLVSPAPDPDPVPPPPRFTG